MEREEKSSKLKTGEKRRLEMHIVKVGQEFCYIYIPVYVDFREKMMNSELGFAWNRSNDFVGRT